MKSSERILDDLVPDEQLMKLAGSSVDESEVEGVVSNTQDLAQDVEELITDFESAQTDLLNLSDNLQSETELKAKGEFKRLIDKAGNQLNKHLNDFRRIQSELEDLGNQLDEAVLDLEWKDGEE